MNLNVLERMAREGDLSADGLRYLLNCKGECEWLDYKEDLKIDSEEQLCGFARDVLGIKNMGGGYIVVGVRDKTWAATGITAPLPYDTKMLRDKVRSATGHDLDVVLVHHELYIDGSTRRFALILITSKRKRRKRRVPTLVQKDFCASKLCGLRRGEIYVRKGDSTHRIATEHELTDLLDDLEAQADEDAITASRVPSPFAIENGFYRLLEKGFEQFVGRSQLRTDLVTAITKDPRLWIINVHGPGGVGKSALVNWCVYEFYEKREFEAIIHLTAKETVLTHSGIQRFSRSLYSVENLLDHILKTFEQTLPDSKEEKLSLATDCLSIYKTLLVLDNMETVQDARILSFVQSLPQDTLAKVVLTSRTKSGGWELPISVEEMDNSEVAEFLRIRRIEMGIDFPLDESSVRRVWDVTGGLPLAVQWVLGMFRRTGDFQGATDAVPRKDSPVLEFSFRNIWQTLSPDARTVLAVATIFEDSPTPQQFSIALEYPIDRLERALTELTETTLMTRTIHSPDGRLTYTALPITLAFARHQLGEMGSLEIEARRRFQRFTDQMTLHQAEMLKYQSRFEKYGLESDNERRAAILCQRGESEMFVGNADNADVLFKQARDLVPTSSYVLAMSASYELARNRVGQALAFVTQACERANRKTGALCYTIKARVHFVQKDRRGRVCALQKAVEFDPDDPITRHQYGVALSINGQAREAIQQFTNIIDKEKDADPPGLQLLIALKTRMLNHERLGENQAVSDDILMVKNIFKKYPHLSTEAHQFAEFF
jgi:tetratricopeptide (TPR) repeat protein